MTQLLDTLNLPQDLAGLTAEQLQELSCELRAFLIDSVSKTGGHLSSSLGVVELAIALHTIFDSPTDKIVWDVGHQSYPHKILTGRKEAMATLRQQGGLSGFTKRSESAHDVFGAGHSSTSISAALGMAYAMQQKGEKGHAIAVIGDGALTGGMAFEALNHAGDNAANLLVVLNDNEMSISENVGAMSRYLGRILSSRPYASMRENSRRVLSKFKLWDLAKKAEEHMKGMVVPGTLFEELGFHYIGPIDGHDIDALLRALKIMKKLNGPQFLHVMTKKGKGHQQAEQDPIGYHGVTAKPTQKVEPSSPSQTYTQVFGKWICAAAKAHPELIAITPAMREGSGLVQFSEQFPDRFVDVGIAEQHSVTLAAGMACEGLLPVVAIYSTFLQRGYDQLIHDVAIQNLPVIFAIDRAGLVGADGPTHAGAFDLSYLRCIPNLAIMAPAYVEECTEMLDLCLNTKNPVAVRYPRGTAKEGKNHSPVEYGKAQVVRKGSKVALLAFGHLLHEALDAAEILDASVVNMRFVKPLDTETIQAVAAEHSLLVTLEENVVAGGAGVAVHEYLSEEGWTHQVRHIGLPDYFVEHGEVATLWATLGLDAAGIVQQVQMWLNQTSNSQAS